MILGVGLLALIDAGISFSRRGTEVAAGLALGYAAFSLVVCETILVALRRASSRLASPLVAGDVEN